MRLVTFISNFELICSELIMEVQLFNVCILSAVNLCGCSTELLFVFYPLSIMSVFYSSFLGLSYCTV